jgi:DNA (cytosine-5)-methyltransferase 1
MTKRLLDLCCGAGGCSVGYSLAGFEVTGVDLIPQPDYPYTFIQADALTFSLDGYDAFHASPTCKGFTNLASFHHSASRHPNLIPSLRARLAATGKPYIIENVAGAPLQKSLMLCGEMFSLDVIRHRYFETNVLLFSPPHPRHTKRTGKPGAIPEPDEHWCIGGHFGQKHLAALAMGITWMTRRDDIAQAIPPPYTEYLGRQLLNYCGQPAIHTSESEVSL